MSDLTEYHAITQTEEVHCVVSPDHLHNYLVDVRSLLHLKRRAPVIRGHNCDSKDSD